ncbi:DUF6527 family protein (plasmid) [Methylomonas sp. 2BW1-5-20]|uniref:DUF6527 family protein n=1 Tax=Methylomonas sp. 2BW1-5-20 TaxID=3376686 RepID=UPI00404EDE94
MKNRAKRIRDRGTVSHRRDADPLMEQPGDFVLVNRGVLRSFVMRCPDGCGETLTINLDSRTDKAWRFYRKRNQISVFPSVWRDTGCCSHFIIWNHVIVWCDKYWDDSDVIVEDEIELRRRVLSVCTKDWLHYTQIAGKLDEVPWDINWTCSQLVRRANALVEGNDKLRGFFRVP